MNTIKWVQRKAPNHKPGSVVSIGRQMNKGKGRSAISLTIYGEMMQHMRWAIGDKVLIGWDEKNIYIRRSPDGTHNLNPTNASSKKPKIGQMATAIITFSPPDDFCFAVVSKRHFFCKDQVSDDGTTISFRYPETK